MPVTYRIEEVARGQIMAEKYWERPLKTDSKKYFPANVPAIEVFVIIEDDGKQVWKSPSPVAKFPYKGTGPVAEIFDAGIWGVDNMDELQREGRARAKALGERQVREYNAKLSAQKKRLFFYTVTPNGGIML